MLSALIIVLLVPPLECPPEHTLRVTDGPRKIEQCVGPNGKLNGPTRHLHPDGTVALEGQFVDTQMDGVWVQYSDLGRKIREETWVKNKRQGAFRSWRDTGSLLTEGQYVDDLGDGVWKGYAPDGTLESTTEMRFDKRHGAARYLQSDGKVRRSEHYVKGRRHGRQEDFYKNEKLKVYVTWQLGQRDGPTERFDASGQLKERGHYAQGRKDGSWEFWRGGRLRRVVRYSSGSRHGVEERFGCDERPQLKTEEVPWAGHEMQGVRVRRSCRSGQVTAKDTFDRGALVESLSYQNGALAVRRITHREAPGPQGAAKSIIRYWPDGSVRKTTLLMPNKTRKIIEGVKAPKGQRRARIEKQVQDKAVVRLLGAATGSNGQVADLMRGDNGNLDAALAGARGITTAVKICGQNLRADAQYLKCTRQRADVDLGNLGQLTGLVELDLTGTAIRALPTIKSNRLQRLALQGTKIKDLRPLATLNSLVYVDLIQTPVTDLSPLLKLPKLTDVTLLSSRVPAAQVAAFRKARPDVRVITRFSDLKRR